MRNDYDFNAVDNITLTSVLLPSNVKLVSRSTSTRKSLRSFRDDPVSTMPVNGAYYTPTEYYGLLATTSTSPSSASWKALSAAGVPTVLHVAELSGATDGEIWKYGLTPALRPNPPAFLISSARSAVLAGVRSSEVNWGVTLGEMRETVQTIASLLRDVRRLGSIKGLIQTALRVQGNKSTALNRIQDVAHRYGVTASDVVGRTVADARRTAQSPSASRAAKAVANQYLRYMYGIRPLMADIYANLELLRSGLNEPLFKVAKTRTESADLTRLPGFLPDRVWYTGTFRWGVKVSVSYTVTNPTLYELWRLGLTNPLSIAWELTSLSFVMDWFTGVGNFIDALQQPLGVSVAHGYETHFVVNDVVRNEAIYANRYKNSLTALVREGVIQTRVRTRAMQRYPTLGFTPPVPYVRLELNSSQVRSLIALITVRL